MSSRLSADDSELAALICVARQSVVCRFIGAAGQGMVRGWNASTLRRMCGAVRGGLESLELWQRIRSAGVTLLAAAAVHATLRPFGRGNEDAIGLIVPLIVGAIGAWLAIAPRTMAAAYTSRAARRRAEKIR